MPDFSCRLSSSLIYFLSCTTTTTIIIILVTTSPTLYNSNSFILYPPNSTFPTTLPSSAIEDLNSSKAKVKNPFERIQEGLARSRKEIRLASQSQNYSAQAYEEEEGFIPSGSVYRNPHAFYQSHQEMLKRFRVWSYVEGDPPLYHKGPMSSIYSIEGHFIDELESLKSPFMASTPDEATVFFLPVSVVNINKFVYRPYTTYSRTQLQNIVKDYVDGISQKYPYWNRTNGGDHFLISCHDWAPDISLIYPETYKHFIRVLCNANTSEGFKPSRDVSLPEIQLNSGQLGPPRINRNLEDRSILAFFAGAAHGDVRQLLFHHWPEGKDKDIQVYQGYVPHPLNYTDLMSRSKYCLCPSGFEVASPRVVESIFAGCVPVIISDGYVLPFNDVLDWTKLSVQVPVKKMHRLKKILKRIHENEYLEKQRRVVEVRRHFEVHRPAKPYDMMHMVMHSVWLRRLNLRLH